ncbi:MAG: hypothetical protein MI757_19040 [Pirellulales bacterium]|nr:hypothetical protein [Pirellulales bacterium]
MEDVRDLEFEKLRIAERALMPQVAEGDHNAIRLLLRIIELRKRYLKDLPYERIKDDPHFELMDDNRIPGCEDDGLFEEEPAGDEPVDEEQEPIARPQTDAERAVDEQDSLVKATEGYLAYELTPGTPSHLLVKQKLEVEREKLHALQAVLEKERSTDPSKPRSTDASTSDQQTTQSHQGAEDRKAKVGDAVRHTIATDEDGLRSEVRQYLRALEQKLEEKASTKRSIASRSLGKGDEM